MGKREQWVCAIWNQYCWEQPFARRDGSAGRLSSSHYDVFIYLFTVQVPKWISKLIMKFEIPHWDTKNCWGNTTFLPVTTHAVLVRAQTYCSDQAVTDIAQRTELSVRLPLSKIRYQNPSYNHSKPRRIPNVNLLTEGNLHGSFVFPSVKMCYKDTAMLLTLSFHCSREHGVGTACISAFCGSHRLHTGSATHKMDTLTHLGTVCCKCWLITPHRYLEDVFLQLQNGASL